MAAGERPAGTPFWGESAPLEHAVNITGTPLGDTYEAAIQTRGTAGAILDHAPMTAGDTFNAWTDARLQYLMPGDAAVASWVVEVQDGAGVLHLRDGISEIWDTPTSNPPNDLGAQTVTGPGTYTWPCTSTVDDLVNPDFSRPWVQVECSSGAIDVQQVKLRVWPPGGPLGGLDGHVDATTPGWDGTTIARYDWTLIDSGIDPDYDASWYAGFAAMQADAAAHPAPGDALPAPGGTAVAGSGYGTQSNVDFSGTSYFTQVSSQTADLFLTRTPDEDLIGRRKSAISGFEGVDFIADPNEVWPDPLAYVNLDEPLQVDWDIVMDYTPSSPLTAAEAASGQVLTHTTVTLINSNDYSTPTSVYPPLGPVIDTETLSDYAEGDPEGSVTHTTPLTVPPEVFRLRVRAQHQYQQGPIPPPHGINFFGGSRQADTGMLANFRATHMTGSSFSIPGFYFTRPAFRYWVPGPAKTILPLVQYPRDDGLRGTALAPGFRTSRQSTNIRTAIL